MFLAEILMQNELAELNSEMRKGIHHLTDLKNSEYLFYNEGAIVKLQNKISHISEDIKDLFLGNYITSLQELSGSPAKVQEKEFHYYELIAGLEKELTSYRNSIAKYVKTYFTLADVEFLL